MSRAWVWAGATAVGTSHVTRGEPCQDAFDCAVWQCEGEGPVLIAALADGAGSAKLAEVGAKRATQAFVETVLQSFDTGGDWDEPGQVMRHAVEQARLALELTAGHNGCMLDDLASTLLAVIAGPGSAVIGQIGDGAVVIDDGSGGWRPVHWPDHGEYANTTSFLTQAGAMEALRIEVVDQPVKRIAMFSDGLERLLLDFRDRSAHGPFFDSVLGRLDGEGGGSEVKSGRDDSVSADIATLLASDKVNTRTDDDKSLLCAALVDA